MCHKQFWRKKTEQIIFGMREINKGTLWYQKRCYKRSLEHFFRAHRLFAASDSLKSMVMSLNNIGNIYRITGETENALLFFDESISIYTEIKYNKGRAQAPLQTRPLCLSKIINLKKLIMH